MESLFPYSSVVGLVEKCLSDGGVDSSVLSSLSALLRHVPFRPDLFSIFASLSASSKLKLKLVSYQLAIRNREDNQLILLFNQALKDLSHSCWNVSMLSLQFLFIPVFDEFDQNLTEKVDKTVLEESTLSFIKDSSTRRAALSALGYLEDWSRWRDVICRLVIESGDLISCVRLFQVILPTGSGHSSPLLSRISGHFSSLSGFDSTSSVIMLDLLDISARNRSQICLLDAFPNFIVFLGSLESSTQISSRLYFEILKFRKVTKLTNQETFCYHVMRQGDQETEISEIVSHLSPGVTPETVDCLIDTESCAIHVSLVKFHRQILKLDHYLHMWENLKYDLVSTNQNSELSLDQLAVSLIYSVKNFSETFSFF